MSDQLINQLPTITGAQLASGDKFVVQDVSDTSAVAPGGVVKSITYAQLSSLFDAAGAAAAAQAASQPLDADLTALAALSGTGVIYYRSAANTWTAVTIGTNLTFVAGTLAAAGGSPGGSDTQLQRNNAGAFGGISGATSDGTAITVSAGNLVATSPKILTSINDTNGNELLKVTATASAVNELTLANAATGSGPTLSVTGDDTNIGVNVNPKGTGGVVVSAGAAAGVPVVFKAAANQSAMLWQAQDSSGNSRGGYLYDAAADTNTLYFSPSGAANPHYIRSDNGSQLMSIVGGFGIGILFSGYSTFLNGLGGIGDLQPNGAGANVAFSLHTRQAYQTHAGPIIVRGADYEPFQATGNMNGGNAYVRGGTPFNSGTPGNVHLCFEPAATSPTGADADIGNLIIGGYNSAPADARLGNGQFSLWLDDTAGTTVLNIKAKDSGGTVRTAQIALS